MMSARNSFLEVEDTRFLAQCEVHTYRASGPGGQKRNKTDSAVRLRHTPTGLVAIGTESRSQHENKARALRRLRLEIALNVRNEVDLDHYSPQDILIDCIGTGGRLSIGRRDARYPSVVAAILDVFTAAGGRLAVSAQVLGISTGNLNKFIQADPKLWGMVNRLRERFGHDHLKQAK
jgi:hypothetical protein